MDRDCIITESPLGCAITPITVLDTRAERGLYGKGETQKGLVAPFIKDNTALAQGHTCVPGTACRASKFFLIEVVMQAILDVPKHVRLRTLRRAAEREGCEVVEVKQRPRDIRRNEEQRAERDEVTTILANLDGDTPITKRVVTLSDSGGFTLARYEGRTSYVFGRDEHEACKRLKCWDKS
jgi:hypothetical protein